LSNTNNNNEENDVSSTAAAALLAKARQIRAEVAAMEGTTLEQVEQEAAARRKQKEEAAAALSSSSTQSDKDEQLSSKQQKQQNDGRFLGSVPETWQEQIQLAQRAVEQAHRDGLNRQIVRFGLISASTSPEEQNNDNQVLYPSLFENSWPGGAQQIYREAAGPLTRALLQDVRTFNTIDNSTTATSASNNVDNNAWTRTTQKPVVRVQDIWDFDGSAVVTAEAAQGPVNDVQALVQPNTDTKYTRDIATMDKAMGPHRLLLIVNPYWRNLESWGINLLAPNAKVLAKEAIFDRGFVETFCMIPKTVRGEDCLALKVYPYNWELYAYVEEDQTAWPYYSSPYRIVHLGSTVDEPTAADFGKLLEGREEFQMSKNMRQLQRRRQRD
jgi:hypothetical protein